MDFEVTHTYERPIGDVFGMLTDFECVRDKYLALGHGDVELVSRDERPDGSVTLVTKRVVPLELPGFAKKVLSPRQSVMQTDTWSAPDAKRARAGTFAVAGKGTPVQVRGAMRLAPKGTKGCTNVTTVSIECKIPLIGGKIAGFVAGDTRRAVEHEQTWIREHLADR